MRHCALFLLLCTSCASSSILQVPDEDDFAVPSSIAEQFVVREETVAPAPASVVVPETPKKQKGKTKPVAAKKKKIWESRWTMPPIFHTGELYRFDITYFGATAGELELELLAPKVVAERETYHIRARAKTSSIFSLFYTMNDVAESYLDTQSLFSHKFSLKLDESLQKRDVLELYDQNGQKAYYWSKLDHKKKGKKDENSTIEILPFTQDGLSAFFYIRTLPLEIGKSYTFPVLTNGKMREVRVTAIRKEEIQTKMGKFPAIVVKPEVVLDGVLKPYGDSFVWISDDVHRTLLKVDAKIKVGSVIAYLREHKYGQAPAPIATSR